MKKEAYADLSERISARSEFAGIPAACHWDITYRCNVACRHCYLLGHKGGEELGTGAIIAMLGRLSRERCLYLTISGGEPFTRPDIFEIYDNARKMGFLITLFTNGTLIDGDIAKRLSKERPVMVEITVHSLISEVFDAVTQVKGSFEACMRGITLLHSHGVPLTLKTVGLSDNADEVAGIMEFAFSMEGVQFKFDPLVLPGHDMSREPCSYRIDPSKIAEMEQSDGKMRAQWRDYLALGSCEAAGCSAGITSFYIDPYGSARACPHMLRPCHDMTKDITSEGLRAFLMGTRKEFFVRPAGCRDCEAASVCGQCPARALLENGHPGKPAEYLCRLAHERAKILGKAL